MSIKYTIEQHTQCFLSKVISAKSGHSYNMVIDNSTDNGLVCSRGDWVSFDQYKVADAPTAYKGIIREQAVDGNWYVEVTAVDPQKEAILIAEVPIIAETYNSKFKSEKNFFNGVESGDTKTVVGFALAIGDIYELSDLGFDGTPVAGKEVTIVKGKHKVSVPSENGGNK